jgi:5-exo-hydroxycamphor dehydrogenase
VIEAAGVLEAFSEGLQLVAPSGRYLIVGLWSAPGTVAVEPRLINNGNLQIIGTALAGPRHLYQAIQVAQMQQSRLPMAEAISHRFTVEQSQQALEAVAAQETVKAVLVPG